MNWAASAAAVRWNIQPFIGGRFRPSNSDGLFENINPANERALCRVAIGSIADIDDAVRVARRRFEDGCWSEQTPARRVDVLLKLADLLVLHRSELALLDSLEIGKPIHAALQDVEMFAPRLLRSWAGFGDKLLGASAPLDSRTISFNTFEPRGVVGAITPWNFPTVNAVVKLAPALAAGNSVVLKPSELASSSALRLAELALEAGLPEGVLNIVPGLGSTVGAGLASHGDVDMISFTGSTITGRKIMELAGRSNGKPLLLECGGKSPHVVFGDVADLDFVADAVVRGAFWNQGQVCSARTRLIVHDSIKDQLLQKVVERAATYQPSDPLDEATTFGPLASPQQRDRVRTYIEQALAAGAYAVLKGRVQESDGCYVAPTIFDGVRSDMAIAREEIFGPVLCIQQFASEAEAIALANDSEYGLEATIWTRDMGTAKRLARAIRAGGISIRTSGVESLPSGCMLGYEPQKASGFGSELGLRGLQSYSTLKAVTLSGA